MTYRPRTTSAIVILTVGAALAAATGAVAAGRIDARTMTCTALQALVSRAGTVEVASSATAYEVVHRDGGACQLDETGAPAYAPTLDRSTCFAGWRCKQHGSDYTN